MMTLVLQRLTQSDNGTFGVLIKNDRPILVTLELPWKDNEKNISCVPVGVYIARKVYSTKFEKELYALVDVPGREFIEMHIGNTIKDTEGCILLGMTFGIGDYLIGSSRVAFNSFMYIMPSEGFALDIKGIML